MDNIDSGPSGAVPSDATPINKRRRTASDSESAKQQEMTLSLGVHDQFAAFRDILDEHVRYPFHVFLYREVFAYDIACLIYTVR